ERDPRPLDALGHDGGEVVARAHQRQAGERGDLEAPVATDGGRTVAHDSSSNTRTSLQAASTQAARRRRSLSAPSPRGSRGGVVGGAPRRIGMVGGTGKEGKGPALRWAAAGHGGAIGSRDAERARQKAEELSALAGSQGGGHPPAPGRAIEGGS